MSVLERLASAMGRNDEVPNQELAADIASRDDQAAVSQLIGGLRNGSKAIQSDCIKVLYEIGGRKPELIEAYVDIFIDRLSGRDNRLIWGAMTALGSIAPRQAHAIWKRIDEVIRATERGSVITQDWGIRVLAAVAADPDYAARIFPFLLDFLKRCPPKDLARHAESVQPVVGDAYRRAVIDLLESRGAALKPAQAKRVQKVIRALGK